MKLRLLAAYLENTPLEDWVKHESEGYPPNSEVPDYRLVDVIYTGHFIGSFGSEIRNAPIPSHIVSEYSNESWINFSVRTSAQTIQKMITNKGNSAQSISIDCSNLMLLLQGHVYPEMNISQIKGTIPDTNLYEILNLVKNKILELTIKIEKTEPNSVNISIEKDIKILKSIDRNSINNIVINTIYGNSYKISESENIYIGDQKSVIKYLSKAGIPLEDSTEFAEILTSESSHDINEPLGAKARRWLNEKMQSGAATAWNIGVDTAKELLKKAALSYYGLSS